MNIPHTPTFLCYTRVHRYMCFVIYVNYTIGVYFQVHKAVKQTAMSEMTNRILPTRYINYIKGEFYIVSNSTLTNGYDIDRQFSALLIEKLY